MDGRELLLQTIEQWFGVGKMSFSTRDSFAGHTLSSDGSERIGITDTIFFTRK